MAERKTPREIADARFARQQRAEDGKVAASDYVAAARRTDENTARLRALRLARDAAQKKPAKKTKRRTAKAIPVEELNASNDK